MKIKKFQKIVCGLLILIIISSGFFLKPKKTDAVLGIGDVVIDPGHIAVNLGGWLKDVSLRVADYALEVALETLKKRLLDALVDQIISWINGEGEPQFVQDFNQTFEDAAQAAVGDVVKEIGLGPVCSPFKYQLQVNLQSPPRFQQAVSCTLDQIVDNFEDFYNDFETGGWIGFSEAIKPQNNFTGALIMSFEELNSRVSGAQAAKEQEISSGRGFLSTSECLEWTLSGIGNVGPVEDVYPVNSDFQFYNPKRPPPLESPYIPEGDNPSYFSWKCTRENITTPGTAIAHGLEKTLYTDIDGLLEADELSAYLAAIADAAINRAIREGVRGVKNIGKAGSTTEEQKQTWEKNNFTNETRDSKDKYDEAQNKLVNEAKKTYLKPINDALGEAADVSGILTEAETKNQALYEALLALIQCLETKNSPADLAWAREQAQIANTVTRVAINNKKNELNRIIKIIEDLKKQVEEALTFDDLIGVNVDQITDYRAQTQNLGIEAETILNGVNQTTQETKRRSDLNYCPVIP